jgi:undecaprenyl diphosphate synthase
MNKLESIGFILDGNRTFGKKNNLKYSDAYQKGADKVLNIINHIYNNYKEVKQIQLYALSKENIENRSKFELKELYNLFINNFNLIKKFEDKEINFKFIGKSNLFSKTIKDSISKINNKRKNARLTVYICIGYGGRQEIIDAVNLIINKKIKNVNSINFRNYLYDKELIDPNIIIRTSNKKRLSGFLLYYAAYSELVFLKKLWPEIKTNDLDKIIKNYKLIKRNFGK